MFQTDPASRRNTDDLNAGRVRRSGLTGEVSSAIGNFSFEEGDNLWVCAASQAMLISNHDEFWLYRLKQLVIFQQEIRI